MAINRTVSEDGKIRLSWHDPKLRMKLSMELRVCSCGSEKVKPHYDRENEVYWIECQKCGSFTEQHKIIRGALKEWNRKNRPKEKPQT